MNSTLPEEALPLIKAIGSPGSSVDSKNDVYHYTSAVGAASILKKDQIWISNARFLNDSSELNLAYDLAKGIAEDKINERNERFKSTGENQLSYCDLAEGEFLFRFMKSMEMIHQNASLDAYIACFAKEDDVLSQWRGYAAGGGFSIGISPLHLITSARDVAAEVGSSRQLVSFKNVEYEHANWKKAVSDLINLLTDKIRERVSKQKSIDASRIAVAYNEELTRAVSRAAPYIKDAGFKEEQEVRLSIYTNASVGKYEFRTAGAGIIPYIQIPLGGAVSSVRVGPRHDYELQLRALKLMNLGESVKFSHSRIPFRT